VSSPIRRPRKLRVTLVRHGPAEDRDPVRWPDDDRRPLSVKGQSQTRRAAKGLARVAIPVRRLASSEAERALATARLVQASLAPTPRLETWPELAPGGLPEPIFERLQRIPPSGGVLLVGHEPTLAEFVGMAIAGDGISSVHFTKGGAACLEFPDGVRPGAGRLVWLLTRKQLADERGRP
jgi:phosphohistidine phosphatase